MYIKARGIRAIVSLFVALVLVGTAPVTGAESQKQPSAAPVLGERDKLAEPTHVGRVTGHVYDAVTGDPIAGAVVSIERDGVFPTTDKEQTRTDVLGWYRGNAEIGRVSSNIDVGRALLSSPVAILLGSATHTTKRVDVSRLNVRVEAEGYKPYEGPLSVKSQLAGQFEVQMQPVLMVPTTASTVSTAAAGWGSIKLLSLSLNPATATSGQTVTATAVLKAAFRNARKDVKISCFCALWSKPKTFVPAGETADGALTYTVSFKAPPEKVTRAEEVVARIVGSTLDISMSGAEARALLQVVPNAGDAGETTTRAAAYDDLTAGKTQSAAESFNRLLERAQSATFDKVALAWLSDRLGDRDTALQMRKELYEQENPKDNWRRFSDYTSALCEAERYTELATVAESALSKMKPKDQPKKVPASVLADLGLAYVATGQYDKASELNERLLDWPGSAADSYVAEFRNRYRLGKAEAALAADPEDPKALADYGRTLIDAGRWEEAVSKLKAALDRDPASASNQADLAYAIQHIGSAVAVASAPTDADIAAAKASTVLDDGKSPSRDFFTWHKLAMLQYAQARAQEAAAGPAAADPAAAVTYADCARSLREALRLGRAGAKRRSAQYSFAYGYISGSETAVSGFLYPEADADLLLLDSLKQLAVDKNRYLAQFNLAAALIDLGQPSLARQPLEEALRLKPDFAEAQFLRALYLSKATQDDDALSALDALLTVNPLHPRANLVKADLLQQAGDSAAAAACLAAHAGIYGSPRPQLR